MGNKKFKVIDSGKGRRKFGTGAVRDVIEGKGRFDLVSPIALMRLAQHYQNGANKYEDRNWERGIKLSVYIDSGIRHFIRHLEGDRTEDHLAAVMWNAAGAIHTEEMIERGLLPKELNDLPNYISKKKK